MQTSLMKKYKMRKTWKITKNYKMELIIRYQHRTIHSLAETENGVIK